MYNYKSQNQYTMYNYKSQNQYTMYNYKSQNQYTMYNYKSQHMHHFNSCILAFFQYISLAGKIMVSRQAQQHKSICICLPLLAMAYWYNILGRIGTNLTFAPTYVFSCHANLKLFIEICPSLCFTFECRVYNFYRNLGPLVSLKVHTFCLKSLYHESN